MKQTLLPLNCFVMLAISLGHAAIAAPIVREKDVYVMPLVTPLKGTVKQEVDRGVPLAKNGDFSVFRHLCSRASEALPYVRSFATHSDPTLRQAAAMVATCAENKEGAEILSTVLGAKGDSSTEALRGLFMVYTPEQIVQWGGAKLKTNLIDYVKDVPSSSEALFVLSSFKGDRGVIQFLKAHRNLHKKTQTMIITYNESPLVPLSFAIDVVLSELGDPGALKNLRSALADGQVEEALYPFHAIRFIDNKPLLLTLVDLFDDDNTSKRFSNQKLIRVKDVAFQAFTDKFVRYSELYQSVSDSEIAKWKIRFQDHLKQVVVPRKN